MFEIICKETAEMKKNQNAPGIPLIPKKSKIHYFFKFIFYFSS